MKALELAKYVLNRCIDDDYPISNLQLQKILYYIQKKYLQEIGKSAFEDEIEAWQFGPVVSSVYSSFCGFGGNPIFICPKTDEVKDEMKIIIDPVIYSKRVMNPWDLVRETHEEGKAWSLIYKNGSGEHKVIPKKLIQEKG